MLTNVIANAGASLAVAGSRGEPDEVRLGKVLERFADQIVLLERRLPPASSRERRA
ncbi:hypothetical protein [Mesorhizobium sp. ORS 3428]|uniref:hypothetical protein n=1 Tax=Mesorhizobium sp. ORS 3428 TaxID=540997 RepID=UPI0012FFA4A9|nr:hypothetical protein [Mesorhizobium sp. ORS 3428]